MTIHEASNKHRATVLSWKDYQPTLQNDTSIHRRLQDFTASMARVWLKVGVVNKVGVVMTTPTCNALQSKPVKASISENIQLKKGSELLNKELSCHCCVQEKEIQYFICTGYQ